VLRLYEQAATRAARHGHGAEPLTIKPTVSGGGELAILPGEETAEGVEPGPFGIKVMRIAGSGATNAGPGGTRRPDWRVGADGGALVVRRSRTGHLQGAAARDLRRRAAADHVLQHPGGHRTHLTPAEIASLAEVEGVRYLKDTSGDAVALTELLQSHGDRITTLNGWEP
jgi:hypothetical protein